MQYHTLLQHAINAVSYSPPTDYIMIVLLHKKFDNVVTQLKILNSMSIYRKIIFNEFHLQHDFF